MFVILCLRLLFFTWQVWKTRHLQVRSIFIPILSSLVVYTRRCCGGINTGINIMLRNIESVHYFNNWSLIDLSGNYVTANTVQLTTTLNRVNFTFVSHRLCLEAQNILCQHMPKTEFGILTIKHANKLKHENEAEGHGPSASFSCLSLFACLIVKIPNSVLCMCWWRMSCASDDSLWEINLKPTIFKVVLSWKQC